MTVHTIEPESVPEVSWITRPWGDEEQYAKNITTTATLMIVKPNQRLSLQAHSKRGELWIAYDDGALILLGWDEDNLQEFYPKAGDKIWIPANCLHRLCSTGPEVRVLEVAFGEWEQADIKRYADDYGRPAEGE